MEYHAIRAHGSQEFWDRVALLARLRNTSQGALVKYAVETALGEELRILDDLSASSVANQQHEQQVVENA